LTWFFKSDLLFYQIFFIKMNKQRGISQIAVMVVMLVLAIALPITTNLIKQSQENRSKASGTWSYYAPNAVGSVVCKTTDVSYASQSECEAALSSCKNNIKAQHEGWACYGNQGTCYPNSSCTVASTKTSCSSLGGSCMNVATCNQEGGSPTTGTDCSATCCKMPAATSSCSSSNCSLCEYAACTATSGCSWYGATNGTGYCQTKTATSGTDSSNGSGTSTGSCTGTYHCVYSGTNNCAGYCIDECGNKDTSSAYDNCGSATTGTSYWYYTTADVTLTTGAVIAKGTCQQTSSTYVSADVCKTSLDTNLSGKTSGVCYASQSACNSANSGKTYWYYSATDKACVETSNKYTDDITGACQTNLTSRKGITTGQYCYTTKGICEDNYKSDPMAVKAIGATEASVAGAPTITSASAVASGTSIKISAVGVSIDHASITANDKSTFVGNMTCSGTTSCTYTVSGLTNGTTYTYWVKACSINNGDTCPAANTAWKSVSATAGSIASVVNIKLAFAGVKLNNGQCATNWPVTLKMVDNTGKSVVDQVFSGVPTQTASVNSKGEIIYDFNVTVNNVPGTGGSDLAFLLTGPKHISLKYGKNNQSAWYSNLAGTLGLTSGSTNSYDFSGYSLLAGDVTGNTAGTPDGKIDGRDFSYIKEKANVLASGAAGTNVVGDLDGNCQVNSGDVRLIKQSLTEINGQTY